MDIIQKVEVYNEDESELIFKGETDDFLSFVNYDDEIIECLNRFSHSRKTYTNCELSNGETIIIYKDGYDDED